jgi:serine/threonine protein kinase
MLAARVETACSDKYVILGSLAMGGMAEILLARARSQSEPQRLVVIKRMHRQLAADREYVQMFLREARIATTLRHPNVVEVYEIGQDNDQHYIAMEHLHGHDLRSVLSQMATEQVPMRLGQALAIARGVCSGLDYTHELTDAAGVTLGIVHRDVSPHNVVLTYNGRVKLVDFGIAKANTHASRTRTGIVKGKVAYMSPEQAMGDALDRRSDVFCIGIMLWEMTTGRRLYRRKSELESLKAVVESDATRPSLIIPGYPPELEQIVVKALARKREERWATAGELGDALAEMAKKRRLDLTPSTLAVLMSTAFREEISAWQDARRAGVSLGDHLVAGLDRDANARKASDVPAVDEFQDPDLEDLPTTVLAPGSRPRATPTSLPSAIFTAEPRRKSKPQPKIEPKPRIQRQWWIIAACAACLAAIAFLIATIASDDEAPPATTRVPPAAVVPSTPSPTQPPILPARTTRPAAVAPPAAATVDVPAASPLGETRPDAASEIRRPVAPKPRVTGAPRPRDAATPTTKGAAAPATKDVAAPATKDVVAPATKDVVAPATKDVAAPATKDVVAPATKDAAAPATKDAAAPATKDAAAPATKDAAAPAPRAAPATSGETTLTPPDTAPQKPEGVATPRRAEPVPPVQPRP